MRTDVFDFNGFEATVIVPDEPCGEWVWKTEFLYAFDKAEQALVDLGYTRVYYRVSNMYGSYKAVRLMHAFYHFVTEKYGLNERCHLFGFSRGGLYAFNFALFYPECVASVYLDAPVLDLNSWPPEGSIEREQVYSEYSLSKDTIKSFSGNPVNNFAEFFSHRLPLLLVAGGADALVPFEENGGRLIKYARERGIDVTLILKPECGHHPHSLEDVAPIVDFVESYRSSERPK